METKMPKVTVIMPVFKPRKEWLNESIKGILKQTFKDFELVVCNDSPKDFNDFDLESYLKEFNDSRIRYITNDGNKGSSASLNHLIKEAKGEYIALNDYDDISVPKRLKKEAQYLDKHKEIDVVSSLIEMFGDETGILGRVLTSEEIRENLINYQAFNVGVLMVRRESLLRDSLFDINYNHANDYEFWSRRTDLKVAILPDVLLKYRRHKDSVTANREETAKKTKEVALRNFNVAVSKQKVALMCIAKDEDNYIDEWVDYHLKLGFDDIYIYCNDWKCKLKNQSSKVHLIEFNGQKQQLNSYDDFINKYYDKYNFAAFIDVDEFIVLKRARNIKQALYNYRNDALVRMPIRTFGNNNLDEVKDNYSVIDRFTKARTIYESIGKYIVNLDIVKNNYKFTDENWFGHLPCINPNKTNKWNNYYCYFVNDNNNQECIELNHYLTKTWEEFVKRKTGLDAKHGDLNYDVEKIKLAYDMINQDSFANETEYLDAYNFYHDKTEPFVYKYNFKVNFMSKTNIPLIKEMHIKECHVIIGTEISTHLIKITCDSDGTAYFKNVEIVNGTYIIRGLWRDGYYCFTRPYYVTFKNGNIYFNNEETTKIVINNKF